MAAKIKLLTLIVLFSLICNSEAKMSHAAAAERLRNAGIGIWSSGGCSDRNNPNCTSLEKINESTIDGLVTLKQYSGCAITVTGGTETGHGNGPGKTHWNGYKADISKGGCIDNYIRSNFDDAGIREDGAHMWKSAAGNIYADEGNHWDIVYQ